MKIMRLIILGFILLSHAILTTAEAEAKDKPQTADQRIQKAKADLRQLKREFTAELNQEIARAKKELRQMKRKAADVNQKTTAKTHQAIAAVENDLQALESQLDKVGNATAESWESVKTTAVSAMDKVKESMANAKASLS